MDWLGRQYCFYHNWRANMRPSCFQWLPKATFGEISMVFDPGNYVQGKDLARISHDFFEVYRINLNLQYIYYNPENRVFPIHIKKTPFGRSDFAASTSLQGNCSRILRLHALRLPATPNFTREKSGLALPLPHKYCIASLWGRG